MKVVPSVVGSERFSREDGRGEKRNQTKGAFMKVN